MNAEQAVKTLDKLADKIEWESRVVAANLREIQRQYEDLERVGGGGGRTDHLDPFLRQANESCKKLLAFLGRVDQQFKSMSPSSPKT